MRGNIIATDKQKAIIIVKGLVSDTLGKLLDELPSLPTKKAIVLGQRFRFQRWLALRNYQKKRKRKTGLAANWKKCSGDVKWNFCRK